MNNIAPASLLIIEREVLENFSFRILRKVPWAVVNNRSDHMTLWQYFSSYVCMYVCMYLPLSSQLRICMCIYVKILMCLCMYVWYLPMYIRVSFIHLPNVCMYVCMYRCMYVYMYVLT
jgi:hypothetical protein